MSAIHARTKTIRQLLGNVKYSIDFYQREYEWERKNIEELYDDLESTFLSSFDPSHERQHVQHYPHYFLGTIITCKENNQNYIVDGQQRLTTLTLLLIHLHHLRVGYQDVADVRSLIFSESYGIKSFNINVPERNDCMKALFENHYFDSNEHPDLSVRNLVDRYNDIVELFPESLQFEAFAYFLDWLIDNVDLVEIEAYDDEAAFTIFETMNDRGKNLGPTDMLKGYLLANINSFDEKVVHDKKTQANKIWKERILDLTTLGKEEDIDFFKAWLRAKYAETIRERKRGATNRDFENINKFHRWIREERIRIGLNHTEEFYYFISRSFDTYARFYYKLRLSAENLTDGLESVYYNAYNNFTLQYMLALAPLRLEDLPEIIERKVQLVTDFIDIYIARRMVNFRTLSYSSIVYTMFNLLKEIRDLDVYDLSSLLKKRLAEMEETFDGVSEFYLHRQNLRRVRYILARITDHIERQSGYGSSFEQLVGAKTGRPFEVEHIWANHYEPYEDEFSHITEFEDYRNRIGGLILIPRGFNQSYNDANYEEKLKHYYSQNLLARSLHPNCYEKNPGFINYINRSSLPFKAHMHYRKTDLNERQVLYRLICDEIWNPERLDL